MGDACFMGIIHKQRPYQLYGLVEYKLYEEGYVKPILL